jgi:hypothetical protein
MGTLQRSVGPGKRSYLRAENVVKLRRGLCIPTAKCSLPVSDYQGDNKRASGGAHIGVLSEMAWLRQQT